LPPGARAAAEVRCHIDDAASPAALFADARFSPFSSPLIRFAELPLRCRRRLRRHALPCAALPPCRCPPLDVICRRRHAAMPSLLDLTPAWIIRRHAAFAPLNIYAAFIFAAAIFAHYSHQIDAMLPFAELMPMSCRFFLDMPSPRMPPFSQTPKLTPRCFHC